MAVSSTAAAASGGKSAFDRASILRDAHQQARKLLTHGCFRGTYRQALSAGLRMAWEDAKAEREEAEWQASQLPIPADVAHRAREMREAAWFEPITSAGNARYSAMLDQARDLEDAAREASRASLC